MTVTLRISLEYRLGLVTQMRASDFAPRLKIQKSKKIWFRRGLLPTVVTLAAWPQSLLSELASSQHTTKPKRQELSSRIMWCALYFSFEAISWDPYSSLDNDCGHNASVTTVGSSSWMNQIFWNFGFSLWEQNLRLTFVAQVTTRRQGRLTKCIIPCAEGAKTLENWIRKKSEQKDRKKSADCCYFAQIHRTRNKLPIARSQIKICVSECEIIRRSQPAGGKAHGRGVRGRLLHAPAPLWVQS